MSTQPEALRLAEHFEKHFSGSHQGAWHAVPQLQTVKVAAELRRLHKLCEDLTNALWKACGDDAEVVAGRLESVGFSFYTQEPRQ